jgi:DNA-binding NarL/FixJ family response regulator
MNGAGEYANVSDRPTLNVFLVEDHNVVREGLRALINAQAHMRVVGEAADGASAIESVIELRPDVVIMDLSMPGVGGAEATSEIKRRMPEVVVLALTAHEDSDYVAQMLQAGASGYVLKRAAAAELTRAIEAVAAHGVYLDPKIAEVAISLPLRRTGGVGKQPGSLLSEREAEVVRMIAQGFAMKVIAAKLELSPRTLETYKARAMNKLGLRNRADIVRYAVEQDWL